MVLATNLSPCAAWRWAAISSSVISGVLATRARISAARASTRAERLSPPELMDWLNLYMDRMAGLVMQHGGVIDDYFGDAIKANFGVPVARDTAHAIDEDARHAVRCALAMGVALVQMNRDWEAAGLPHISMRVGIATGEVVAGCLGSAQRMKFTTLGDIVNTAARLETYTSVIVARIANACSSKRRNK